MKPKILVLDIETGPAVVYTWSLFKPMLGVEQVIHSDHILCWAAKWVGERHVYSDAVFNYPAAWKKDPRNEETILEGIWDLIDEADIVVTQNGDRFDLPWLNSVFLKYGWAPPSPARSVDTLKVAKKNMRFLSNKLDYMLRYYSLGKKMEHEGFRLWWKCMDGDPKAWAKMIRYNRQDVVELEKLYLVLRPYMPNHPNMGTYLRGDQAACPQCGGTDLVKNGYYHTSVSLFQRYKCKGCGNPRIRGRFNLLTDEQRANLVTNAL